MHKMLIVIGNPATLEADSPYSLEKRFLQTWIIESTSTTMIKPYQT